jgi:hypothetical protein
VALSAHAAAAGAVAVQFAMLWSVVCLNGIAGVSVLSTGKVRR